MLVSRSGRLSRANVATAGQGGLRLWDWVGGRRTGAGPTDFTRTPDPSWSFLVHEILSSEPVRSRSPEPWPPSTQPSSATQDGQEWGTGPTRLSQVTE